MKTISKSIYFFISAILIIVGVIVKYFLVDINVGARFKDFNQDLLLSDIIFIAAAAHILIGLIFYAIRKSEKAILKDFTILLSAILLMPTTLIIAFVPLYETLYPGEMGETAFASFVVYFTMFAMLALFIWIFLLIVTFIKQAFIILTRKVE